MRFPFTVAEVLHFIPLAIGYAIILTLFLKSRRDVKRFREVAEDARAISNLALEGQGTRASMSLAEAASLADAAAAQSRRLAARAELLRTYRRRESAPRVAASLAAGERR
jgi:hypothetical protein